MAIGIVLGLLFALLMAAGIVVFFLGTKKTSKLPRGNGRTPAVETTNKPLWKILRWAGLGAGVLFALLLFFIPGSFHTVNAGEIAVVKHLGDIKSVRTAGTYFDFWITEEYEVYDAKVQTLDIRDNAYSLDAQTMDICMTVQYQIDTSKVKEIATTYGSLEALSAKIRSVSIERAKSVLSSDSAMKIIETRESVSPKVETAIKSAISESYYVTINTAVLTNIDFSDAFEQTVEQKMIAEQQQLQAQYEAEKAKIEAEAAAQVAKIKAEAELSVAKLAAEARIAAAQGDAKAQVEIAKAEARATKLKSLEVARMLGFEVIKVSEEVKNDDGTIVEAEYEIKFDGASDEKIAVIAEYLKYIEYLSKWNGELPDVITGDSATIMIPMPGTTVGQ
ncbi:MAG: prohibitin family protein [Clostridiales bacterium]|nr:prohibitin family protein [Clostridiales bacterium]